MWYFSKSASKWKRRVIRSSENSGIYGVEKSEENDRWNVFRDDYGENKGTGFFLVRIRDLISGSIKGGYYGKDLTK